MRGYMTHKGIPDFQRASRHILKDFVMVSTLYLKNSMRMLHIFICYYSVVSFSGLFSENRRIFTYLVNILVHVHCHTPSIKLNDKRQILYETLVSYEDHKVDDRMYMYLSGAY